MPETQCWEVEYVMESYFYDKDRLLGTYRTEQEANEAAEKAKAKYPDLGVVNEFTRSYIEVRRSSLLEGTCWIPQAVWLVWCCTEKGYVEANELLGVYTSEALADARAAQHAEFAASTPYHAARECTVEVGPRTLNQ